MPEDARIMDLRHRPPRELPFSEIQTHRLLLEPIAERHAQAMFEVLDDPTLYRYMPSEIPASAGALRQRYRFLARGRSPDGSQAWLNWIVCPLEGCIPIGYVQATVGIGSRLALLGWMIGRAAQGRGYARDAVRALCEYLVQHGIDEMRATIDVRNAASLAVAVGSGFTRDSTVRSEDVLDGVRGMDHNYVLRASRA